MSVRPSLVDVVSEASLGVHFPQDELLVEMRVYVPTKSAADAENKSNAAQALQNLIKRRAGIMESSAEAICTFVNPTPLFLTPRYVLYTRSSGARALVRLLRRDVTTCRV